MGFEFFISRKRVNISGLEHRRKLKLGVYVAVTSILSCLSKSATCRGWVPHLRVGRCYVVKIMYSLHLLDLMIQGSIVSIRNSGNTKQIMTGLEGNRQIYLPREFQDRLPKTFY